MTLSEARAEFEREKKVWGWVSTYGVNFGRTRRHTPSYLEFYNFLLENYGSEIELPNWVSKEGVSVTLGGSEVAIENES